MKRSQTTKIADHKQKGAFYPLKISCLCSKYEIKSSQTGWGDGSMAEVLARQTISSRARAHCPAHAPTARRARSLGPVPRTRAPASWSRSWPTHAVPRTRASSLTPGLATRSAAVSALPGTHVFPLQPLPCSTQGPTRDRARSYQNRDRVGARAAIAGGWLPRRVSAEAWRDPAVAVCRLERHLLGRERTAEAPDLPPIPL